MSKPVSRIIGAKDGYVTGVHGFAFVMRVNGEIQPDSVYSTSPVSGVPEGYTSAQNRSTRLARDERKSAAIARARQRMGDWYEQAQIDGKGLVALRLKAGLSQTELAKRLNMQQPNLSRLEKGLVDPKLSTIKELAIVLGLDLGVVANAVSSMNSSNEEI